MSLDQWDTDWASLPRKRISAPAYFASVRVGENCDFDTVTLRPRHTVGPIVWPASENGIAGIQEVESRLARPLRLSCRVPAIAESGTMSSGYQWKERR